MSKSFLVYFTTLPKDIESLVNKDKHITVSKEGIREYNGAMFPRLCIRVVTVSPSEDKDRSRMISNLLQYLKDGRQIIDFTTQG